MLGCWQIEDDSLACDLAWLGGIGKTQMEREKFSGPVRKRYAPPASVEQTDLRSILEQSTRGSLEPKQFDLLSKGKGPDDRALAIYYAGEIELVRKPAIAVIGTRNVSDIGRKRANKFARELAEANVVVVSGLAAGVDTQALGAAINNSGRVIAVIGTPLDKAYPAENANLQELIYREHLLISQFSSGTRTFPSSFPARNRTMAAISDGSVIIEATESSGTLHQAAECVRLGRWLAISKSVVEDKSLEWPSRFSQYEKFIALESTEQLLEAVYGDQKCSFT